MPLSPAQKKLLNNATPGLAKAKLGDMLDDAGAGKPGLVSRAVHVPNAAAAPTQAEFNALLTSLRNAGVIASS